MLSDLLHTLGWKTATAVSGVSGVLAGAVSEPKFAIPTALIVGFALRMERSIGELKNGQKTHGEILSRMNGGKL